MSGNPCGRRWTGGGAERIGPTKTWRDPDLISLMTEAHGPMYVFGSALLNQSIKSNFISRTV